MDTKSFNRLIQIEMSRENFEECFEQAKAMEKEQMKKLLEIIMWYDEESDVRPNTEIYNWFKQYYNETFKLH